MKRFKTISYVGAITVLPALWSLAPSAHAQDVAVKTQVSAKRIPFPLTKTESTQLTPVIATPARVRQVESHPLNVQALPKKVTLDKATQDKANEESPSDRALRENNAPKKPRATVGKQTKPKGIEPFQEYIRKQKQKNIDSPPRPPFTNGEQDYTLAAKRSENLRTTPTGPKRIWVEWECEQAQRITGQFTMRGSEVSNLRRLGATGDEVAMIRAQRKQVDIYPGAPHRTGGFVFDTDVRHDSILLIQMQGEVGASEATKTHVLPLATSTHRNVLFKLPGGIRVRIRKDPVPLNVLLSRPTLIFNPGETFSFELLLDEVRGRNNSKIRCVANLLNARSDNVISNTQQTGSVDPLGQVLGITPFKLKMPKAEGAYDVHVKILNGSTVISERIMQLLVVDRESTATSETHDDSQWQLLQEVDLAKTAITVREESLEKEGSPRVNEDAAASNEIRRSLRILGTTAGRPHALEFVCNGLELAEYDVAVNHMVGGKSENLLTSRFRIDGLSGDSSKHKIIFWPPGKEVRIIVTQRENKRTDLSTKLRILAGPETLARVALPKSDGKRTVAAYLDSPVMGRRYGVRSVRTPAGHQLQDWKYYLESGSRNVEFLSNSGYSTVMMTVAGGGGTIYPSASIVSSVRYDNGDLFPLGAGTRRKDVLELMFRLFDRAKMTLVPTIRFDFPISELEARITDEDRSLRLLNKDGLDWWEEHPTWSAAGPYYNSLHPIVQQKMQKVVDEIVNRYSSHKSFGGIALVINGDTYLQPPATEWATDQTTRDLYKESQSDKIGTVVRSTKLSSHEKVWRRDQIKTLLSNMTKSLTDKKQKLYVIDDAPNTSESHVALRNQMLANTSVSSQLIWVGTHAHDALDSVRRVKGDTSGMMNVSASEMQLEKRVGIFLPSPQAVETTGAGARQSIVNQIVASDADVLVQHLPTLTSGQSENKRNSLMAMQAMPVGSFKEIASTRSGDRSIRVRSASSPVATYAYIVNNSAWPATVTLNCNQLDVAEIESNGGSVSSVGEGQLETYLPAYEMASLRIPNAKTRVLDWEIKRDETDAQEMLAWCNLVDKQLQASKAFKLQERESLSNPSFDKSTRDGRLVGWGVSRGAGITSEVVQAPSRGDHELMLRSDTPRGWPSAPIAWARSNTFDTKNCSRLIIEAKVRAEDDFRTSRLRMVLLGHAGGKPIQEEAWVELASDDSRSDTESYHTARVQLPDFEPSDEDELQVVFELHGGGQVWIEHVAVYDRFLSKLEITQLESLHRTAIGGIRNNDFGPCLAMKNSRMVNRLMSDIPTLTSLPSQSRANKVSVGAGATRSASTQQNRSRFASASKPDTNQNATPQVSSRRGASGRAQDAASIRSETGVDETTSRLSNLTDKPSSRVELRDFSKGMIGSSYEDRKTRTPQSLGLRRPLSDAELEQLLELQRRSSNAKRAEPKRKPQPTQTTEAKPSLTQRIGSWFSWNRGDTKVNRETSERERKEQPRLSKSQTKRYGRSL